MNKDLWEYYREQSNKDDDKGNQQEQKDKEQQGNDSEKLDDASPSEFLRRGYTESDE